jgi:hypothetical protein
MTLLRLCGDHARFIAPPQQLDTRAQRNLIENLPQHRIGARFTLRERGHAPQRGPRDLTRKQALVKLCQRVEQRPAAPASGRIPFCVARPVLQAEQRAGAGRDNGGSPLARLGLTRLDIWAGQAETRSRRPRVRRRAACRAIATNRIDHRLPPGFLPS